MTDRQTQQAATEIARHRPRLRNFIRKRISNDADVEDILQDVFSELVEAYRLIQPIEQVGAWLFRVAKNRITDFFRKARPEPLSNRTEFRAGDDGAPSIEDLLPSETDSPEAAYLRGLLLEELDRALSELPVEQQDVFIAHELEGRSFKELATESGLSMNTLLARKHYAVRHLRKRLQAIYDEFSNL